MRYIYLLLFLLSSHYLLFLLCSDPLRSPVLDLRIEGVIPHIMLQIILALTNLYERYLTPCFQRLYGSASPALVGLCVDLGMELIKEPHRSSVPFQRALELSEGINGANHNQTVLFVLSRHFLNVTVLFILGYLSPLCLLRSHRV
jgi:hypothetical protein